MLLEGLSAHVDDGLGTARDEIRIDRCTVSRCGTGLCVGDGRNPVCTGNYYTRCEDVGIRVRRNAAGLYKGEVCEGGPVGIRVDACADPVFESEGKQKTVLQRCDVGILAAPFSRGTFKGAEVIRCRRQGVRIERSANPFFSGCKVTGRGFDNASTGAPDSGDAAHVLVKNRGRGQFVECEFSSGYGSLMVVVGGSNPVVTRCDFWGASCGVMVMDGGRGRYVSNNVSGNDCGVFVSDHADPVFTDNHIKRNTKYGVVVQDGGMGTFVSRRHGCVTECQVISENGVANILVQKGANPCFRRNWVLGGFAVARGKDGKPLQEQSPTGLLVSFGGRGLYERNVFDRNHGGDVVFQKEGTDPAFLQNEVGHVDGECEGAGIVSEQGARGAAEGNKIRGHRHGGIVVRSGGDTRFARNLVFSQPGKHGAIWCHDGGLGVFDNNEVQDCSFAACTVATRADPLFRGNTFQGCGRGVTCRDGAAGTFDGNTIRNCRGYCVSLSDSKTRFTHNTVEGAVGLSETEISQQQVGVSSEGERAGAGVLVKDFSAGTFECNDVARNATYGVYCDSAGAAVFWRNRVFGQPVGICLHGDSRNVHPSFEQDEVFENTAVGVRLTDRGHGSFKDVEVSACPVGVHACRRGRGLFNRCSVHDEADAVPQGAVGFKVHGVRGTETTYTDAADPKVVNCDIHHCRIGVQVVEGGKGEFVNNTFTSNVENLHIATGADPLVSENELCGGPGCGVVVYEGGRGRFVANNLSRNALCGVELRAECDPLFEGNTINSNGRSGVLCLPGALGRVLGNTVAHNGGAGVRVRAGAYTKFEKNDVVANEKEGIVVEVAGKGQYFWNTIRENKAAGILVQRSAQPDIQWNSIHSGHAEGVLLEEAGGGTVIQNKLLGNAVGIGCIGVNYARIERNAVALNPGCGVDIREDAAATVERNLFAASHGDGGALRVAAGGRPVVADNDFIGQLPHTPECPNRRCRACGDSLRDPAARAPCSLLPFTLSAELTEPMAAGETVLPVSENTWVRPGVRLRVGAVDELVTRRVGAAGVQTTTAVSQDYEKGVAVELAEPTADSSGIQVHDLGLGRYSKNFFTGHGKQAFHVAGSQAAPVVRLNVFTGNDRAMVLQGSALAYIAHNQFSKSRRGSVAVCGGGSPVMAHNTFADEACHGVSVEGEGTAPLLHHNGFRAAKAGIVVRERGNPEARFNVFEVGSGVGVRLESQAEGHFEGNEFKGDDGGAGGCGVLLVGGGGGTTLSHNVFHSIAEGSTGLTMEGGESAAVVRMNHFRGNHVAVRSRAGGDALVEHNLFTENGTGFEAVDGGRGTVRHNKFVHTHRACVGVFSGASPVLDGNYMLSGEPAAAGFLIGGGGEGLLTENIVAEHNVGIQVVDGGRPQAKGNEITECVTGLRVADGSAGLYEYNLVQQSTGYNVEMLKGSEPTLTANRITGGRKGGVLVQSSGGNLFGNAIDKNHQDGILVVGSVENGARPQCEENVITATEGTGLRCKGAGSMPVFDNNDIERSTVNVIIEDAGAPMLVNNHIFGATKEGCLWRKGGCGSLVENKLYDNEGVALMICPTEDGSAPPAPTIRGNVVFTPYDWVDVRSDVDRVVRFENRNEAKGKHYDAKKSELRHHKHPHAIGPSTRRGSQKRRDVVQAVSAATDDLQANTDRLLHTFGCGVRPRVELPSARPPSPDVLEGSSEHTCPGRERRDAVQGLREVYSSVLHTSLQDVTAEPCQPPPRQQRTPPHRPQPPRGPGSPRVTRRGTASSDVVARRDSEESVGDTGGGARKRKSASSAEGPRRVSKERAQRRSNPRPSLGSPRRAGAAAVRRQQLAAAGLARKTVAFGSTVLGRGGAGSRPGSAASSGTRSPEQRPATPPPPPRRVLLFCPSDHPRGAMLYDRLEERRERIDITSLPADPGELTDAELSATLVKNDMVIVYVTLDTASTVSELCDTLAAISSSESGPTPLLVLNDATKQALVYRSASPCMRVLMDRGFVHVDPDDVTGLLGKVAAAAASRDPADLQKLLRASEEARQELGLASTVAQSARLSPGASVRVAAGEDGLLGTSRVGTARGFGSRSLLSKRNAGAPDGPVESYEAPPIFVCCTSVDLAQVEALLSATVDLEPRLRGAFDVIHGQKSGRQYQDHLRDVLADGVCACVLCVVTAAWVLPRPNRAVLMEWRKLKKLPTGVLTLALSPSEPPLQGSAAVEPLAAAAHVSELPQHMAQACCKPGAGRIAELLVAMLRDAGCWPPHRANAALRASPARMQRSGS
eukprot:TRINITY_DN13151_c0_g2_i1.p1 TRINITY_DN13151_c0_g2~~TRINITY_DN13151_c0_g2_i1.p1  ORF type:complete len:2606 (+),score=805.57 TRINITY_DN13151_c0_g2_i1:1025-7819(+)